LRRRCCDESGSANNEGGIRKSGILPGLADMLPACRFERKIDKQDACRPRQASSFMNRIKFHVKKGDNVEVISGNFRGSSGKILQVLPKKQRVLIEGVRIIKKHLRKSQDNPSGKIAEREGPIHISNVRLIEKTEKKGKTEKKETKAKKTKS
jgi:large subunit ribosomal protein L24